MHSRVDHTTNVPPNSQPSLLRRIASFLFELFKNLPIDDIGILIAKGVSKGNTASSLKLMDKISALMIGFIGIIIYGAEAIAGLRRAVKAFINKDSKIRAMKIATGALIFAICGSGLGVAIAYTASGFGVAIASAPVLPLVLPILLTLSYCVDLVKFSYKLHLLKKEKKETKIATKNILSQHGDHFNSNLNECLLEERRRLQILQEEHLYLQKYLDDEIQYLRDQEKQIDTNPFEKQALNLKRLNLEGQALRSSQINEYYTKKINNNLSIKEEKKLQKLEENEKKYFIKHKHDFHNSAKIAEHVTQFQNKHQSHADTLLKINYAMLKEKKLKCERDIASKAIEITAGLIVIAGAALSLAAVLTVATFGIAPIALLITGIAVGFGMKIFEMVNDKCDHRFTNRLRHGFKNLFKRKHENEVKKPLHDHTQKNDAPVCPQDNQSKSYNTTDIHKKLGGAITREQDTSPPLQSFPTSENHSHPFLKSTKDIEEYKPTMVYSMK